MRRRKDLLALPVNNGILNDAGSCGKFTSLQCKRFARGALASRYERKESQGSFRTSDWEESIPFKGRKALTISPASRCQMRATREMRDFARRLIAYEKEGEEFSGTKTHEAFRACDKLRPHLTILLSTNGFRALLSRALALANAEVIWLRAVHVKADGSLEGLDELETQVAPDGFSEGGVVLLAQILALLVAFIGEKLTLHLMSGVWPKVSLNDLGVGGKNEKTK